MTDQERASAVFASLTADGTDLDESFLVDLVRQFEAVRREERQRVVAYLRSIAGEWNTHHRTPQGVVLDASADRIERGEAGP